MWTTILIVVVLVLAGFLLYVLTRPNELRVERKGRMRARPEQLFEELNDLRRWVGWSPWERLDPAMVKTHSGAERGVGAIYSWKGNAKVGEGRMEILESSPPTLVRIKLDFIKPFPSSNTTTFTLAPQGEFTEMTWAMRGPAGFMTKLMCVFMDLDQAIGKDFERGIANLREVVEEGKR
jgi:hypothetical protein